MWRLAQRLRNDGVTIILTTHYIDEAEQIADRIGVIDRGRILLVEEKIELMRKLGRKQLTLDLSEPLSAVPPRLERHRLTLSADGLQLVHTYDAQQGNTGILGLLADLAEAGVRYKDLKTTGAFIVPGLIMLLLLTQSLSNASFAIFFPKFNDTIYELLSAPVSTLEILIGYVGAAATKSTLLGLIILATAALIVPVRIARPLWMISFLGGSFYSIDMLPPVWQKITMLNPVLYLISGFRWSFYELSDVGVEVSLAMILAFLATCIAVVTWMFRTGYRIKR